MKKTRIMVSGFVVFLATIMLIISSFSRTPLALAAEYNQADNESPQYVEDKIDECGGIGYLPDNPALSAAEKRGRCTWYHWTGGNDKFYRQLAIESHGDVDLLKLADSRRHDERFKVLGAINDPGCQKATKPDKYGLWLDECKDPHSSGIMGIRKFENPNFDPAKWDVDKYAKDVNIEPPYRIGLSCGVCHVAFNPLKPPADPEHPKWENLVPALGNQYIQEGRLFGSSLKPDDFRWHVINTQQPGTSDTSRIGNDHINNPNAVNAIFNLGDRPAYPEVMNDGSTQNVPHILKDGADSVGVPGASLRVYVNIGTCGDYWLTLHDALAGNREQQPFRMDVARKECEDWRQTEARMADAEAFLKTLTPLHLASAPGGADYLSKDQAVLDRGKEVFATNCAQCHSSKQPPAEIAINPEQAKQWYIDSVKSSDFLDHNFLSDDKRYPVSLIGTNIARAMGTNAMNGQIWEEFSSKTYKNLPSVGKLTLYNPFDKNKPINFTPPSGGPGYYRTPSLISVWSSAPLLHNNSVGTFNADPSVAGRMAVFEEGMEKLLWPKKRDGYIKRTSQDSTLGLGRFEIPIPKGTPVNLIANVDTRDPIPPLSLAGLRDKFDFSGGIKGKLTRYLLRVNKAPDFIEDKGHTFGSELPDADKKALIEFIKTF